MRSRCSIVSKVILNNLYNEPGIHPLEDLGQNVIVFQYIIDELKRIGIKFKIQ